jgi:Phage tail lysozyme
MAIKDSDLAEECVHQGIRFGIHPHYLVGVAKLRSGINDPARIGVFRLTQTEWNANCFDDDYGITDFVPDDVNMDEMQCCIYALMAWRAQNRCLLRLGQLPTAVDLYREQWPADPAPLPNALQDALDATKALMDPAFTNALGGLPETATTIQAGDFTPSPKPNADKPVPTKGTETFVAKVPSIMQKLIADFGLKDFQAAGILGNIGEECDGFREMQEKRPIIPGSRGGFGWAQWTGDRRIKFEAFCTSKGLSPFSDAANYGYLKLELSDSQADSLAAVKKAANMTQAVQKFEQTFERAKEGLEHFDIRNQWANLAIRSFRANMDTMVSSTVARILDPDLVSRVIARANLGTATFMVIDQSAENGGQLLVKQDGAQPPIILASDTTIFPIKPGLIPSGVVAQLSASFDATAKAPGTIQVAPPADDADVRARIFATAQQCDETLVTRDAPNTNHGRLACAFAVNEVVRRAIGHPVGGGNSTAEMGEVLANTQTHVQESDLDHGLICISPTHGANVGHVGIVGEVRNSVDDTLIYSNSSSRGVFSHTFTLGRWKAFYRNSKGLPVFFFALKK